MGRSVSVPGESTSNPFVRRHTRTQFKHCCHVFNGFVLLPIKSNRVPIAAHRHFTAYVEFFFVIIQTRENPSNTGRFMIICWSLNGAIIRRRVRLIYSFRPRRPPCPLTCRFISRRAEECRRARYHLIDSNTRWRKDNRVGVECC